MKKEQIKVNKNLFRQNMFIIIITGVLTIWFIGSISNPIAVVGIIPLSMFISSFTEVIK